MFKEDKNFLALDLELNNGPDSSTPNPKIIQVGISIGNLTQEPKDYLNLKWYIDPQEKIYPGITELTGITNEDISRYAVTHERVAGELSVLIEEKDVMKNAITWGGGDVAYLLREFKERKIDFKYFQRNEIDIANIYMYLMLASRKGPFAGLKSAMGEFKLNFVGEAHRADVDASNTLAFFFLLVKRQMELEKIVSMAKSFKR